MTVSVYALDVSGASVTLSDDVESTRVCRSVSPTMLVDACAACIMIFWYRAATSISTSHAEPFATTTLKSAASVSVGDELSKATDVGTGKNEGAAGAALALTSAMARHTRAISAR